MAYNTHIPKFYPKTQLFSNMLTTFKQAGVPAKKLIVGIQPYESSGGPATPCSVITKLAQFIKKGGYGGLFMWGIGTNGLGKEGEI